MKRRGKVRGSVGSFGVINISNVLNSSKKRGGRFVEDLESPVSSAEHVAAFGEVGSPLGMNVTLLHGAVACLSVVTCSAQERLG